MERTNGEPTPPPRTENPVFSLKSRHLRDLQSRETRVSGILQTTCARLFVFTSAVLVHTCTVLMFQWCVNILMMLEKLVIDWEEEEETEAHICIVLHVLMQSSLVCVFFFVLFFFLLLQVV